jgi:hypothetical protein
MNKRLAKIQNRRQLMAAALRYGTLGLLGTTGVSIFTKRRKLLREGICINDGVCRGCEVFRRCGLPQALSAKQVLVRIGNGGK